MEYLFSGPTGSEIHPWPGANRTLRCGGVPVGKLESTGGGASRDGDVPVGVVEGVTRGGPTTMQHASENSGVVKEGEG